MEEVKGILLCLRMKFDTGNEPYIGDLYETFLNPGFIPIWKEADIFQNMYNPLPNFEVSQFWKPFALALIDMNLRKRDYINAIPAPEDKFWGEGEVLESYREEMLTEAMWKLCMLLMYMDKYPMSNFAIRE